MLALVLIGQLRTWNNPLIINSYKKYLSDNEKIDLYIFTWNKLGYSNNSGNTNIHIRQNDSIDRRTIIEYYQQFTFINIRYICLDDFEIFLNGLDSKLKDIYNTPFRNHAPFTTSIPVQYKYQQAAQYLSNIENNDKYSNIIITRPDICFTGKLSILNTVENTVYFQSICDRCIDHFWYGKPNTIIKQLRTIFDNYIVNYTLIDPYNENNRDNNEILHFMCSKNNILVNVLVNNMCNIIYF
jgi:hypothetical protein